MRKKIVIGLGLIVLLVGAWLAFDYYHYFPPGIGQEEIKQQAKAILQKESPSLLRNNMNPNMRKEVRRLDILEVAELKGKTYLVFKLDFDWIGAAEAMPYGFNSGGYILGLRMVEKKIGGISLKDGMEFESNYLGVGPVDCGQDKQGVFYGFCKDPRVKRASLETREGKNIALQLGKRVILAQLPDKNMEIYPHFFTQNGNEIEVSYGMKIAFLSKDEKSYQQYTNTPMEWWALQAQDCAYLRSNDVDAIWVFPDQQQEALRGDAGSKLRELADEGIPVIFIALKDSKVLLPVFKPKGVQSQEVPMDDIEALYVGKEADGSLKIATISMDDAEAFPIMQKSIFLRYQLQDYMPSESKSSNSVKKANSPATANGPANTKGVTK